MRARRDALPDRIIPFAKPLLTSNDRLAVDEVLRGTELTNGEQVRCFEKEFARFLGDEDIECVAVSSCFAALYLALLSLGVGPGDEVILPALTHVAMVQAVELAGARPVFVDCDFLTDGNVTVDSIGNSLSEQTRAISVVHFMGMPCCMDDIVVYANKYRLYVIEDCALALGAKYAGKKVGTWGTVAAFSFYPSKHITTGEGGMVAAAGKNRAQVVRKMRGV